MKRVYFDNAATTPMSQEVIDVMANLMKECYGNPSSIHKEGRESRTVIEKARKQIAELIGASIGEIFFTSGGTEANNMALKCSVRDLGVKRIISTKMEHHCNLHSFDEIQNSGQAEIVYLDVDNKGKINYVQLEDLLHSSDIKTLVCLMHCNNEIGTLIDLERVAAICGEYDALFHTDTVQTMGYFPIDVSKTRISFLAGGAHKFHGPKGVGFIYINGNNIIKPYINGGSQERNMRAGTENLYGIAGMAKALELTCTHREENVTYINDLRIYMKEQLQANFEDIQFNGCQEHCHFKTLSVSFPQSPKSEVLLLHLDMQGICASGGSACSSGSEKGSHVLEAIGADPTRKSIRFSFSKYNTKEEVDFVIEKLKNLIVVKEMA